ncbi:hypothetical protein GGX14DRAFT_408992 [Mycena pura]|uniref:Uncharacterized protein n=1 Tax=Mycena pura TaxID=153505 RepID=A0AAD6XYX8_9AGAR|nr:hypothetical protein GGX14DRAFT_408992 [Mycena pura]
MVGFLLLRHIGPPAISSTRGRLGETLGIEKLLSPPTGSQLAMYNAAGISRPTAGCQVWSQMDPAWSQRGGVWKEDVRPRTGARTEHMRRDGDARIGRTGVGGKRAAGDGDRRGEQVHAHDTHGATRTWMSAPARTWGGDGRKDDVRPRTGHTRRKWCRPRTTSSMLCAAPATRHPQRMRGVAGRTCSQGRVHAWGGGRAERARELGNCDSVSTAMRRGCFMSKHEKGKRQGMDRRAVNVPVVRCSRCSWRGRRGGQRRVRAEAGRRARWGEEERSHIKKHGVLCNGISGIGYGLRFPQVLPPALQIEAAGTNQVWGETIPHWSFFAV